MKGQPGGWGGGSTSHLVSRVTAQTCKEAGVHGAEGLADANPLFYTWAFLPLDSPISPFPIEGAGGLGPFGLHPKGDGEV